MVADVQWLVPDQIIFLNGMGDISSEDANRAITQSIILLDASHSQLVHIIMNTKHAGESGLSVSERIEAIRLLITHEKCGWIIMIRNIDPLNRFVSSTADHVLKANFRSFNTIKEALEFLKDMDPNLPDDFQIDDDMETV